jgi:hypothetical protein
MRSEELDAAARQSAYIGDANAYPAYTQTILLNELNDKLQSAFEDIVVKARSGYWLHEFVYTATGSSARFRIPPRAVVGGLEKVEISASASGQPFNRLEEIPQSIVQNYEGQSPGFPYIYTVQGDQVEVVPMPTAGMVVRLTYYIRPSRLVPSQSDPNGTQRGKITSIAAIASRQVTVNALPFDQSLTVPVAITSGSQTVDVVHPDGWHELSLVGAAQTFSGFVITFGGTDSLGDIQVGDYVRVADQTDWPCLPDDFHRSLADTAAIKILYELHALDKAQALELSNGYDLQRFRSLLLPRVKSDPKQIPILRRARGWGYPGWRLS